MKIKDIALEQRPRERLKIHGVTNLSDTELLAIILQNGSYGENVIDLSNRLISTFGLEKLNSLSLSELMKIKGIGMAKATKIISAFEISKRVNSKKIYKRVIKNSSDVAEYYTEKLRDMKKEQFIAVFLDSRNKIIHEEIISVGTLDCSLAHQREIFKPAIQNSASGIIIVHNHPSGNPTPSGEDKQLTEKLISAGEIMGINVLDHVIVGDGKWWSWTGEN